ncbi:MAG: histidine kinase [Rubrivivax sp.]|nr:histidine kinase [Rubrivivax sp.]
MASCQLPRGRALLAAPASTLQGMSWLGIDWSQVLYPGPRHPFSPDDMARAGSDAPSPTAVVVAVVNVLMLALVVLMFSPAGQVGRHAAALAVLAGLGAACIHWLWWRPWRRALMQASLTVMAMMIMSALLVREIYPVRSDRLGLAVLMAGGGAALTVVLWFIVVYRAQQIESRLREQAERSKAIEMARRLATAQIEPHFLFNTLAGLQHWVQTKDDRAAPMLAALTGYLRATLPLFNRPRLALGDELSAVQQYLQVMQLRMGERLSWQIDVPETLRAALLPPGILLTLVENAVVHGLEPSIAGGAVRLRALAAGGRLQIEVANTGRDPEVPVTDGVGLANLRQRLQLAHGALASLHLQAAPGGGCLARVELPLETA